MHEKFKILLFLPFEPFVNLNFDVHAQKHGGCIDDEPRDAQGEQGHSSDGGEEDDEEDEEGCRQPGREKSLVTNDVDVESEVSR